MFVTTDVSFRSPSASRPVALCCGRHVKSTSRETSWPRRERPHQYITPRRGVRTADDRLALLVCFSRQSDTRARARNTQKGSSPSPYPYIHTCRHHDQHGVGGGFQLPRSPVGPSVLVAERDTSETRQSRPISLSVTRQSRPISSRSWMQRSKLPCACACAICCSRSCRLAALI